MSKLFLMSCGFVIYIDVIWMMAVLSGLSSVKERMFLWTHESLLMVCQRVFSSLSTVSMSSDESGRPVYCSVRVHHHHHGLSEWLNTSNGHFLLFPALQRSGICDGLLKLLITSYLSVCDVVGGGLCSGGMSSEIPSPVPQTEHSDTMMHVVLWSFYNIHAGESYVKLPVIRVSQDVC